MKKGDFNRDWTFVNKTTKEKRKINLPYDAMIHEKSSRTVKTEKIQDIFPVVPIFTARNLTPHGNGMANTLCWNSREFTRMPLSF